MRKEPFSLSEISGGKRQSHTESLMPVLPIMNTITHTKFGLNLLVAHQLVYEDIQIQKEVIIATVKKPLYRTKLAKRFLVSIPDETNGIKYAVDEKAIDAMTVAHWIMK